MKVQSGTKDYWEKELKKAVEGIDRARSLGALKRYRRQARVCRMAIEELERDGLPVDYNIGS